MRQTANIVHAWLLAGLDASGRRKVERDIREAARAYDSWFALPKINRLGHAAAQDRPVEQRRVPVEQLNPLMMMMDGGLFDG